MSEQTENDRPADDVASDDTASGSLIGRWTASALGALSHPKAPVVVGLVFLLGLSAVLVKNRVITLPQVMRPAIVVFDPVRFMNAQRAAASIMALSPSADTALTLTQVAKQAEAVIRDEAQGAVILVKQAVVAADGIPDITDAVLERFGLPTQVPTVATKASISSLDDIAPTDSMYSTGKLREDYRLELQRQLGQDTKDILAADKQNKALP